MSLEDQLRNALRREDPSEGFAERVIRQAGPAPAALRPTTQPGNKTPAQSWRWLMSAAAAAALVFAISTQQHRQTQAEAAGRQAVQALQVVAQELNFAQNEVLNK